MKRSLGKRAVLRRWFPLLAVAALGASTNLAAGAERLVASNAKLPAGSASGSTLTASSVAVTLAPAMATISGSQTVQFSATVAGSSNTAVTWSVSPQQGSISATGLYTAPAWTVSSTTPSFGYLAQMVQVTATSQADPTQSMSATVIVTPSVAPNPGVAVSVSPAMVSLSAGQSQQFGASVTGTSNTGVTWSMNPAVGTLSNGLYTAPGSVTSGQQVTITAVSSADSTKSASATVTLVSTVGIGLSPSSVSLTTGQSSTFTASISGTANTAVTWSISPAVGTVVNGVYTAPATISALQTVLLTAVSQADPTKTAQATITLLPPQPIIVTLNPNQATLPPGQSQQFTASVQGTTNAAVSWSISPQVGSITTGGLYTAPASVSGPQTVWVTATSAADSTKAATAVISIVAPVKLPVEVIGPDGTTSTVSFTIPSGANLSGPINLWMKIHGLEYQTEASLQLNNSGWIPINSSTVTLLGLANAYGGIGGAFHTLQMNLPVQLSWVNVGANTLSFRFNGTDGAVSGFRVLAFNLLASDGSSIVPAGSFFNDDPNTWQPPSTLATDIAAGKSLWYTAPLTVPTTAGPQPIRANCTSCHAQDGRDLKYFNYSNNSIRARSLFHGLTAQQGDQIASYIRSLNVPNPGRPWNPPYQPGPGLDSQPVANWAGGAGVDAVLGSDAGMLAYLMPGGSTANWTPTGYISAREMPLSFQLPDWNHWLPRVHPMDAWPDFTGSSFANDYPALRALLKFQDAGSYKTAEGAFSQFYIDLVQTFIPPKIYASGTFTPVFTATYTQQVYSTFLWELVKDWEVMQEFGLEGLNQSVLGTTASTRGWYSNFPFFVSPNQEHIPVGSPGLSNSSVDLHDFLSMAWYQVSLILNGSQLSGGTYPEDFQYVYSFVKGMSGDYSAPQAGLQMLWLLKGLEMSEIGIGPDQGSAGWQPTVNDPSRLVSNAWVPIWTGTPSATRLTITQAYLQQWFAKIQTFTPQQFYQGGWASPTVNPVKNSMEGTFGDRVWFMIPQFKYLGVDPTLINQMIAWAATIWPNANWSLVQNATCWPNGGLTIMCSSQQ